MSAEKSGKDSDDMAGRFWSTILLTSSSKLKARLGTESSGRVVSSGRGVFSMRHRYPKCNLKIAISAY